MVSQVLPKCLSSKESSCNAGDARDVGSISGSGRSPGGGHGNAYQYSCLENPMESGAWWAMLNGVAKSQTQMKWISTYTHTHSQGSPIFFSIYNPLVGLINHLLCPFTLTLSLALNTMPDTHSVQFSCSVVPESLWPHGLQHTRPPCPPQTTSVFLPWEPQKQYDTH